jgi:hypothetical protein
MRPLQAPWPPPRCQCGPPHRDTYLLGMVLLCEIHGVLHCQDDGTRKPSNRGVGHLYSDGSLGVRNLYSDGSNSKAPSGPTSFLYNFTETKAGLLIRRGSDHHRSSLSGVNISRSAWICGLRNVRVGVGSSTMGPQSRQPGTGK